MLEIVNKGSQGHGADWHEVWKGSEEVQAVRDELHSMHEEKFKGQPSDEEEEAGSHDEFAMPFFAQLKTVTHRVFQQYWRMPEYILAKWMLGVTSGLFIGFSFFASDSSTQGLQNVLFSVFMITAIFSSLVQQVRFPSPYSTYQPRLTFK
jgi:ATP-binding cassette subfamily G (WHITE) protein 2 (PDR)